MRAIASNFCQDICIFQFVNNLWFQYTSQAYQMNCVKSLALWKCARNEAMLPRAVSFHRKNENAKKWSYDKMLIDWVRSGRTGKYLALGQDARTSLRLVRTSWPRAKYFPVRPSHSVNKYILLLLTKRRKNRFDDKTTLKWRWIFRLLNSDFVFLVSKKGKERWPHG